MTNNALGLLVRILAIAALAVLVIANVRLFTVATATQPRCVDHVKAGDTSAPPGSYGASGSSC